MKGRRVEGDEKCGRVETGFSTRIIKKNDVHGFSITKFTAKANKVPFHLSIFSISTTNL
jgi:hypothetical protein